MSEAAEQIRQILDPILLSMGLDLWDLEFQKQGPVRILVFTFSKRDAKSKSAGAV